MRCNNCGGALALHGGGRDRGGFVEEYHCADCNQWGRLEVQEGHETRFGCISNE